MSRLLNNNILSFIFLILFQVMILNNINFGGYTNPYLYVMYILLLPFDISGWGLLIIAFLMGFSVDIFSNTLGLHSAATVLVAFLRPSIIKLTYSKQEYDSSIKPGIKDLGLRWFLIYSLVLVSIHHFCLFFLEIFSFNEILTTIYRCLINIVFTMILIIISQYLLYRK